MKNADALVIKSVTLLIHSALALMVLSSLLALSLPVLLNPNNYKARIADKVLEKTGRTLTFSGDMEWSLFPNPSLTLKQISLSNAPGFGPGPMIQIQRLHGHLNLRNLFKLQFVMEQPSATGVELFLESDATGKNNWDDLVAQVAANRAEAGEAAQKGAREGESAAQPDELLDFERDGKPGGTPVSLVHLGTQVLAALSVRSVTLREGSVRLCRVGEAEGQKVSCLQATHLAFTPQSGLSDRRSTVQLQADLTTQEPLFTGHVTLAYRPLPRTDRAITQWQNAEFTMRGHVNLPLAKEFELVWRSDVTMGPEPYSLHITQSDSTLTVWSDKGLFREFALIMKKDVEADLRTGKVAFSQGGVTWRVKSDQLPPVGVAWDFQSAMAVDWRQETLDIDSLQVSGPAQSHIEGRLHGDHLLSRPSLDAQLTAVRFDPRALLVAMGRSVPFTADPTALQSGSGSAAIHLDDQSLAVTDMVLEMDHSRIVGNLHWNTGEPSATGRAVVRFDLQGDRLDLDRYLPPEWTGPDHADAIAQAMLAPEWLLPELPSQWLQGLDLQGHLSLGEVQTASGRATDLSLIVGVQDRILQWQPYRMTIHEGTLETRLQWDDRGDEPVLTVDKSATDIQIEPLLHLVADGRWLTGRVNGVVHLSSQGRNPDTLWKNRHGTVALMIHDGTIQGMDLAERFREGYAASQEARSVSSGVEKAGTDKRGTTSFTQLTATGQITGGVVDNQDFRMLSALWQATGKGSVDLTQRSVDYTLEVDGMAALPGGLDPSRQRLVLPVRLQGDFGALKPPLMGALRPASVAQ